MNELLLAAFLLMQPEPGRVSGLVNDRLHIGIAGLTVNLVDAATGKIQASTKTSEDGRFELIAGDGVYRIAVVGDGHGFRSETSKSVRIDAGRQIELAPVELINNGPCRIIVEPLKPANPPPQKAGLFRRLFRALQ